MAYAHSIAALLVASAMALTACGGSDSTSINNSSSNTDTALNVYEFDNKYGEGSSVSYSGQTTRHVLIAELTDYIGNRLQTEAEDGTLTSEADVLEALNQYFQMSAEDYELVADSFSISPVPNSAQTTLRELSNTPKNLLEKMAGNDATGQYKDWNNGEFAGWGDEGSTTPTLLLESFFELLAANASAVIDGQNRQDAEGNDLPVYVTESGLDLKQLIQKFLLMSVAYSQSADDYLDFDTEGKGLLTTNDMNVTDKSYTNLEHQFDEGFGYFGAARDYLAYTDEEIAGSGGRAEWSEGYYDTNSDGSIDLFSEVNFGQSVNAAKRDLGATVATDYTAQAMAAFLAGRALIATTDGALSEAAMTELQNYALAALDAWERAIAATVVHYINDTTADLNAFGTDEFDFINLAKHWGEMKGFGLGLQYNRHSPLDDDDFAELHSLIGDAPVFSDSVAITAYLADLAEARDLLEQAYQFNSDNVANW